MSLSAGIMSGHLRDRIFVQERSAEQTATGIRRSWATKVKRWGRVMLENLDGRAKLKQVGYSNVTHKIVFRGRLDLSLRDTRFVWNNMVFEPIDPDGNPDLLEFHTIVMVRWIKEVQVNRMEATTEFPIVIEVDTA